MSKGNMLLGHARGKVGSLVFSRANGKQITRSRAEVVKNPRTQEQMIQRIILNTVAQGYSKMKSIVDHSFEGLSVGQASMSFFMRRNMDLIRTSVARQKAAGANLDEIYEFSPLKSNYLAKQDYLIAKGTLPEVRVIDANNDAQMAINVSGSTYADLAAYYGLRRGDQLTFCGIIVTTAGQREFQFVRVILDPHDAQGNEVAMNTPFCANGAVLTPSDRNEGTFSALTNDGTKITFGLGGDYLLMAAVIVSRKNADGTWLRSNATLKANASETASVYDMQTCLNLLSDTSIAGLSDLYLNNAGIGNVAGTGANGGADEDDGPSGEG